MKRLYFKALTVPAGGTREDSISFRGPGIIALMHLSLPEDTSLRLCLHGRQLPEPEGDDWFEGPLNCAIQNLGLWVLDSPFSLQMEGSNTGGADATIRLLVVFSSDP